MHEGLHQEHSQYVSNLVAPLLLCGIDANNAPGITDVGDLQYFKIRPVLLRLESPAQLHEIETNSPQISGENAELWRTFIARDFPNWEQKNYVPKNPLKWYRVYLKYKKEQQIEIAKDEEILRASMGQLKKAKETNVSKVVDLRLLPKVPRDPWMMANNGGVPLGKRTGLFKKEGPSSLVWSGGSKTKLTNGQSVLTRARREAKEISQRSKLAKPTHELRAQAGQVRKAPAGMVNEYKKASEAPIRILSRKKKSMASSPGSMFGSGLEERERRLAAIQAGSSQKTTTTLETVIGSSDDDDELDADDAFSSMPRQTSRPAPSSPHRPAISDKSYGSPSSSSSRPSPKYQPPQPYKKPTPPFAGTAKAPSYPSATPSPNPISRCALSPPALAGTAQRGTSPGSGQGEKRPPPGMVRKRPQVDIFNRGASKKPRTR